MSGPPPPPTPPGRRPRLAAGRARALGLPTRGTTAPNRLRRMDNWIVARLGPLLRAATDPLVIDLGFGASPVTTIELARRLGAVRDDVRVLGLEIDASRVASARPAAAPPRLDFAHGGFELAGHRPVLVRAANVLRQYPEPDALAAWDALRAELAAGGALVEGTCDEVGRRACWVLLDAAGARSVTFACRVGDIERPSDLAERLPKALIHHNVPGRPVHALLQDWDAAWAVAAPLSTFGPRQRWQAAGVGLLERGWAVDVSRSRLGELTVPWASVKPS